MLTAMDFSRPFQKRNHSGHCEAEIAALEPRVLLSATVGSLDDPEGEPGVLAEQQSAGVSMMSFLPAWDQPVATPTNLAATAISETAIRVSWTDNAHNETGFGVAKWMSGRWRVVALLDANATEYVDTNLMPGSTHLYRIHAFNDYNSSGFAEVSGTTLTVAPTGLEAVAVSASEIELTWSGSPGASGYHVERSLDGITGWMFAGATDWFTLSLTDTGLNSGTTYHYRVMAVNAGGLSAASAVATATTEQAPVQGPAAPEGLMAAVFGHKHVRLTWASMESVLGYIVERSGDGQTWNELASVEGSEAEYKDMRLGPGTYVYRVRAVTEAGVSAPGDVAIATVEQRLMTTALKVSPGRSFSTEPILQKGRKDDTPAAVVLGG